MPLSRSTNQYPSLCLTKLFTVIMIIVFFLAITFDVKSTSANSRVQTKLSGKQQKYLIAEMQNKIIENYVEVEEISNIVAKLEDLKKSTTLKSTHYKKEFVKIVNHCLQKADKHFSVSVVPRSVSPAIKSTEPHQTKETWFEKLERQNYGFNRVEVLTGNIGIIDFWGFADLTKKARISIAKTLRPIENADAMIIDLRENGGGSAQTVQFIASYFIQGKVHLNSFYTRQTNHTEDFYTFADINFPKLNHIPIVVLVGPNTFSAAEEFAYNLKHMSRAVIIGEPTKGGANPWRHFSLKHDFRIAIPVAKAINPFTKSNWEGVGVKPHHIVELELAEKIAIQMLKRRMLR